MRIRLATIGDLAGLPAVENSAAQAFRGTSQDDVVDGEDHAVEFYVPLQTDGCVLVAEADGPIVGFAACQACRDALHLWELAVRLDRQGQGVGRSLLDAVVALARSRGLPAVTLTTFRDIAWNAPMYARMGFEDLDPAALNPRLISIREREAMIGLDMPNRCAMRLAV
jgi:GNAT superfamily N-acetyltransferase